MFLITLKLYLKYILYLLYMHPIAFYINYLIEDCYKEDYNPFYAEFYYDNYCYEYTFIEWYFFYRKRFKLYCKYKHTPIKLIIGY